MTARAAAGRITAVLGPTNTGKTHLAMERMLGHASGMIGFPLRLLARENYDRIVRIAGKGAVALVTGEERIVPPHPRWFVATVEAMPLDRKVEFLAVDEIQLMADPERGHVFTDRLLHARGLSETMFIGSDTVRPLLRKLVPEAEIIARPRFSTLSYTGPRKVTRLPPRSAVVAFSVADVFELAELVRRQRGGTAVVMGALSPRARNAQVAMYQAGEVDYMVATDAIGMGLNMDLDHVAFARLSKFDGRAPRRLTAPEIAQIAGRAGRHMNDGTFGTTAEIGGLEAEIVEAVENHRFDPLRSVWWRNSDLDFRAPALLLRSLGERPPLPVMRRAGEADDQQALEALARDPDIVRRAGSRGRVRLLWEVCQIPDFRKVMSEHHARLLGQIFRHLTDPEERLPEDWVARQLKALDRTDGEIDALVQRIAHIRTWTYITHRPNWLDEAAQWQERAIGIEDRLSDALHDRITQRFVDRRSALLVRRLGAARDLAAAITAEGEVRVEGVYVGEMRGLAFVPDRAGDGETVRTLVAAANRVLPGEIQTRVQALADDPDEAFRVDPDGRIAWRGVAVVRLAAAETALAPRVEPLPVEFLDGVLRETVRRRLERFIRGLVAGVFRSLAAPVDGLAGPARGLLYRLGERLGSVAAAEVEGLVASLAPEDRRRLSRLGVRFGRETVYVDRLLKPAAVGLRALLWSVYRDLPLPAPVPPPGRLSVAATGTDAVFWDAIGYRAVASQAIRVDRLESFAACLRTRQAPFTLDGALASRIGLRLADLPPVVRALGYRSRETEGGLAFTPIPRRPRKRAEAAEAPSDHPFAKLAGIEFAQ
ncbi:MAG TPA: helicase-related protein [Stellaceae bacterium]|nr:helicase-related protein [Stellaceae bacterium]